MDASRGSLKNQGLGLFVSLVLLLVIAFKKEEVDFRPLLLPRMLKPHGQLQWTLIRGKFFPSM